MNYEQILFAESITEEQFFESFMTGKIRIYTKDKNSFIDFCTLMSEIGFLKLGNESKEYGEIYDQHFSGMGVLYYMDHRGYFDPYESRTYRLNNMSDSNPHQQEEWKNVIYFDEILKKIKGYTADNLNHANRIRLQKEKADITLLLKKHGGNIMSRRVGNFYDEKTGDYHWLEPDTVHEYPLPPGRIAELGQTGYRTVNYHLASNEENKTIELTASVELSNGKVAESDPVAMDELYFAELLFDAYMNDQTFANRDEVKDYTNSSLASLAINAHKEHGIILDGLELDGFGSIFYGEDRVATFDSIKVKTEPYISVAVIHLFNSVSQTTLIAEKNPSASFIANGYELTIPSFNFKEVQSGIVTQYTIETETLSMIPTNESYSFNYVYDDTVTTESPYMQERIEMLASAELEDAGLEDRFNDIFSL